MSNLPTRYLEHVGTVAYLRTYASGSQDRCPIKGYHDAMVELTRSFTPMDNDLGGSDADHAREAYPRVCACGAKFDELDAWRHILRRRLFRALDGTIVTWEDLKPGDMFFLQNHYDDHHCHAGWSNCDGKHLHVVLPEGTHWDVDSRANNCTMRDDTVHRCWVRHGDPTKGEPVHVDKQGVTCHAGAGSIVVPGYHGFLHHGQLIKL